MGQKCTNCHLRKSMFYFCQCKFKVRGKQSGFKSMIRLIRTLWSLAEDTSKSLIQSELIPTIPGNIIVNYWKSRQIISYVLDLL